MDKNIIFVNEPRIPTERVDIFLCALGYEARVIFFAQQKIFEASRSICLKFSDRHVLNFEANERFFAKEGFLSWDYSKETFLQKWVSYLRSVSDNIDGRALSIVVDISSMSRPMLAQVVFGLCNAVQSEVDVSFVYCPAEYSRPSKLSLPVIQSGPVIPEYAGWTIRPDLPLTVLVGAGYEYGRALGMIEFLEPAEAWAMFPYGEDRQYDRAVLRSNIDFYRYLARSNIVHYKVDDPNGTFATLEGLIYALRQNSRPIIVPFGPKIFSLSSLLVAEIYFPFVTVWRVSGEQVEEPVERRASGKVIVQSISLKQKKVDSALDNSSRS